MDLSFPNPTPAAPAALPAAEARMLAVSMALWGAAGETARVQAALDAGDGADRPAADPPATGAFNPAMAARLIDWGQT